MSHDPFRFVELLRDQLTSADRRIVFLFGAGSSCAVNAAKPDASGVVTGWEALIPAIIGLTDDCRKDVESLGAEFQAAWVALEQTCAAQDRNSYIENILSLLRATIETSAPTTLTWGLDGAGRAAMEAAVVRTIARIASPSEDRIPPSIPHDDFARWVRGTRRKHPVEIFTTNYDILIERALERARVPLFDGFVGSHRPFFDPALVARPPWSGTEWAGLWKVHGSVNWQSDDKATVRTAAAGEGVMIHPSHLKYDQSRQMPYSALIGRFAQVLASEPTLLITIGYGWGDQHLNSCVIEALERHPANSAIALMYDELETVPDLVALAVEHPNLLVAGRRSAVLGGREAVWALANPGQTDLIGRWYASDASTGGVAPTRGELKLGDFNLLAAFFGELAAGRAGEAS